MERRTSAQPGQQAKAGRFMRLRAALLSLFLLLCFGVVLARAAKVQLFDVARLSRLARDQTRREIEWAPRRGEIEDRRGQKLAVTLDVDSVFADPSAFPDAHAREAAADGLSRALAWPRQKILRKLESDRRFVWLARRVDDKLAARVRALNLDGVELVKEPKRFYPQCELAGHLLGFVGEEAGQEGLERELEPLLRGKTVSVPAVRDARGNTMLTQGAPDPEQLRGATVTLTIDAAIQMAAERELRRAVVSAHAVAGWAVVMDVQSGALLALAAAPAFDANKPGRDPQLWRNRAVQDQLEPGSTIKSFVVADALESGVLKEDESIYCEHGAWKHLGHTLHDTHPVDEATPMMVLRESSNICAAKIGEKLGKDRLIAGLRRFGFGERTAVGLPGEGKGALRDPKNMPLISVDTTAFGQGMSATGLQTVVAMAAIANGGVLLKPFVVEKVVAPDGSVLLRGGREEVRRVLQPETAKTVTAMLEEVTRKGGTGTRAALADFRVAGKTGTAQKVDPVRGGYGEKRLSSFLGFLPAEAPRLAILVAIDEPEGKVYGGEVAAPAWGVIAREALRQLGVTPASSRELEPRPARAWRPQRALPAREANVAAVEPLPVPEEDELAQAAEAALGSDTAEQAEEVEVDVQPAALSVVAPALATPGAWARAPDPARRPGKQLAPRAGETVVPDLSGLAARSALRALAERSLEAELKGSGRAVAQTPRAGAIVKRGARVRVTLAPPK